MTARVKDEGTILQKTVTDDGVAVDLSAATVTLIVVDSGGNRTETTGSLVNDGTDGICQFVTTAYTWLVPGVAKEQVRVVTAGGSWHSEILERTIQARL